MKLSNVFDDDRQQILENCLVYVYDTEPIE